MNLNRCQVRARHLTSCLLIFTVFSTLSAYCRTWDTEGAQQAFEEARKRRSEIAQSAEATLDQYLACARTYRLVHIKDPHYRRTGDAIYEEGLIYQEMAEKFGDTTYYKIAAKRFNLLVKDYGSNRNCPDALLRMGNIYLLLDNPSAAQEAFQRIRTQYRHSAAYSQLAQTKIDLKPEPAPVISAPAPAGEVVRTPGKTTVHNVRFWSTDQYTRVMVDMDLDTSYHTGRLSDPPRLFFDIANSRLSASLRGRTFAVEDKVIRQIRVGQNRPDVVRVVLDLSESTNFSVSELHDPFRILIDLDRKSVNLETGRKYTPVPLSQLNPELALKAPLDKTGPSNQNLKPSVSMPAQKPVVNSQVRAEQPRPGQPPPEKSKVPQVSGSAVPQSATKATETAGASGTKTAEGSLKPEAEQPPTPAKDLSPKSKPPSSAVTDLEPFPSKLPSQNTSLSPESGTSGYAPERAKREEATTKLPSVASTPSGTPKLPVPTRDNARTLTRMLGLKVGTIVIDPGHGGHDWGCIGPNGLLEKDVTLSLAVELKSLLEANLGAKVILTRSDDSFVSLEERTAIANRERADLFISIHVNSSRSRVTSGIETYYLDFAATETEREVAARENATSLNGVYDLEDLVKKIAQADKSMESRELASVIQKNLYSGTRKLFPSAKNRGVRKAPFVVLIGAKMPSVLVEVAFISNPKDERVLRSPASQKTLTAALYSGIEDYIKTLGVKLVDSQPIPE